MPTTTTTTTAGTSIRHDGGELSEDDVFEVLSNRRRRFVIHALKHADEPLEVGELSTYVAAWETGLDPEDVDYQDRRNVHTTLRRTHLPTLERNGVVIMDENDRVRPTPALEDLDIYVEVLREREIPWSLYYAALAVLSSVLLLAVVVGAPGFAALTPLNVAVFAATIFGVSAVAHHLIGRRMRLGDQETPPELRTQS